MEVPHDAAEEFYLPMVTRAGLCKAAPQSYGSIGKHCNRLQCALLGYFRNQKRNPEELYLVDEQAGQIEEAFLEFDRRVDMGG